MSKVGDVVEIDGVKYEAVLSPHLILDPYRGILCQGCAFESSSDCLNYDDLECKDYNLNSDFIWRIADA